MELTEVEITYKDLFKLIELEEKNTFKNDEEYFQKSTLEILDDSDNWISINGLIKKESQSLELEINHSTKIVCAENHIIQLAYGSLVFAKELSVGDILANTKKVEMQVITDIQITSSTDVYDVEVDNQTHLYQCSNGFIHHNTLLTSAIVKYANMLNMRTIIIVPSSSLLKQTYEYIKQFDIPVGMFGNGKKDEATNIVATWQTLQNNKIYIKDFECVIWDECLHPT